MLLLALAGQLRDNRRWPFTCGRRSEYWVFLHHYKLLKNPFAPDVTRPLLISEAARATLGEIDLLLKGETHCLLLSGPAGVGKTALIRQRLRDSLGMALSWVAPDQALTESFFKHLLSDLGLEAVDGSVAELRKITEVYLGHQAGQGRRAVVVADSLEALPAEVLREIEWLAGLRLRGRPVLSLILASRSEDILLHLMPQDAGNRYARSVHQRLAGFSLDETRRFVHACLFGAGCQWGEELFPEDSIVDVQAFTQGIVGDISTLCCRALDRLAERVGEQERPVRVSRLLLKDVGTRLGLRYDPLTRQLLEEALTPDAVQLSTPESLAEEAAYLQVTSGGRTVANVVLGRSRMVLGRDKTCDISLNSNYVSRYQNLFFNTPEGWLLIDLNSTNGSFVNGRRVREHRLRDGDVIAVGIHQLRFNSRQQPAQPIEAVAKTVEHKASKAQMMPNAPIGRSA